MSIVINYIPDQNKTIESVIKTLIKQKTQKMCDKTLSTSSSPKQFVFECYITQEVCDKTIDTCPFVFDSVPDRYKTYEMCYKAVSKDIFRLKYFLDKYKSYEMCDNAFSSWLLILKFIPDWFVTNMILETLDNSIFFNGGIFSHDIDSNIITFLSNDIGFHAIVYLNNINTIP